MCWVLISIRWVSGMMCRRFFRYCVCLIIMMFVIFLVWVFVVSFLVFMSRFCRVIVMVC